jgi:hypothetical protein
MDAFKKKNLALAYVNPAQKARVQVHWVAVCESIHKIGAAQQRLRAAWKALMAELLLIEKASAAAYIKARESLRRAFVTAFTLSHPDLPNCAAAAAAFMTTMTRRATVALSCAYERVVFNAAECTPFCASAWAAVEEAAAVARPRPRAILRIRR